MRPNLAMLAWGLSRLRKGRSPDLREVASRVWELCPEETATGLPAIHLPGALGRIAGLSPWRTRAVEEALVAGGPVQHAATRAHLVEDVALAGAFLYRGAAKAQPGHGRARLLLDDAAPPVRLAEAHLVSNWAGSNFFGNFLLDDLPLGMIPPPGAPAIAMPTKPYGHAAGYRALLGLPAPPVPGRARIRRLTLYTDFAQNSYKAARYRELRRRLRAALPGARAAGAGVYIRRGATGERRILANAAAVERRLGALGFDILDPAVLGAAEIARLSLDARIVAGVEGSHLSHAIYSIADAGAFLVLQPPDRFAMAYKEFADRLELRFGFVVGTRAADGFAVDPDELEALLGRLA